MLILILNIRRKLISSSTVYLLFHSQFEIIYFVHLVHSFSVSLLTVVLFYASLICKDIYHAQYLMRNSYRQPWLPEINVMQNIPFLFISRISVPSFFGHTSLSLSFSLFFSLCSLFFFKYTGIKIVPIFGLLLIGQTTINISGCLLLVPHEKSEQP